MSQYRRIGEMLVDRKLLTSRKLKEALQVQPASNMRLGELLVTLGHVSEEDVASCLAEQYDFELVNPETTTPSVEALTLVDWTFAQRYCLLPISVDAQEAKCLVADPMDVLATDVFEQRAGRRVRIAIAPRKRLLRAIARAYGQPYEDPAPVVDALKRTTRRKKLDPQVDRLALLDALSRGGETL